VAGHVDGVGTVTGRVDRGDARELEIAAPPEVTPFVAPKGSITVDGISLTVARRADDSFAVALIPHTLAVTTLGASAPGTRVNLEADLIAKYVEALMPSREEVTP